MSIRIKGTMTMPVHIAKSLILEQSYLNIMLFIIQSKKTLHILFYNSGGNCGNNKKSNYSSWRT